MDECVPIELLDEYAEVLRTTLDGDAWLIAKAKIEAICAELRAQGSDLK